MKRIIFSFVVILLSGIFGFLYCFTYLRDFLTEANVGVLVNVYNNLDSFFDFVWNNSFAHFVIISGDESSLRITKAIIIISAATLLLVILIDVIASIIAHFTKRSAMYQEYRFKQEKEKLDNISKNSKNFSKYDPNNIDFANNKTPYIVLSEEETSLNNGEVFDALVDKYNKKFPWGRMVFSIGYCLISIVLILIRFSYLTNYSSLDSIFSFLYKYTWFNDFNESLTSLFSTLFVNIYYVELGVVGGAIWNVGLVLEIVIYLVFTLILLLIILFISHLVLVSYRKKNRDKINTKLDVNSHQLSSKALSVLGDYSFLDSQSGNISDIAEIHPSKSFLQKEESIHKKASYIDEIGLGVEYKGIANPVEGYIPVSKTRRPYVLETIKEDLSGNSNITLDDIPSIEQTNKKEDSNDVSFVNISSYVDKDVIQVDLSSLDISQIADISKLSESKTTYKDMDDLISFDEDGDAYLVKQGSLLSNQEEDISDVLYNGSIDKSSFIAKYGQHSYEVLDSIEPFELESLNVDDELENIQKRMELSKKVENFENITESLIEEPFKIIDKIPVNSTISNFTNTKVNSSSLEVENNDVDEISSNKFEKNSILIDYKNETKYKKDIKPVDAKIITLKEFEKDKKDD